MLSDETMAYAEELTTALLGVDALYREQILDHYKHPHNFGELDDADLEFEDMNPLCGDELRVQLSTDDEGRIEDVRFSGQGCADSGDDGADATRVIQQHGTAIVAVDRRYGAAEVEVHRAGARLDRVQRRKGEPVGVAAEELDLHRHARGRATAESKFRDVLAEDTRTGDAVADPGRGRALPPVPGQCQPR